MQSSAAVTPPPSLTVRFDGGVPVIRLPDRLPFDALRRWLRNVIPSHLDVLGGRTARLDFGRRDLVLFDVRRLVHGLEEEFGILVTGLYLARENVVRFAQRELKLKLFFHEPEPDRAGDPDHDTALRSAAEARRAAASPRPVPVRPPDARERLGDLSPVLTSDPDDARRSLPVFRTLRSGSQIRFDGHVYVYGDVNPGAQVVATGHIAVMGTLKGVAHAGAHGDESAFILAFQMRPTQLRIGRHLAPEAHRDDVTTTGPEVATVQDQTIRVRPYDGRIPN